MKSPSSSVSFSRSACFDRSRFTQLASFGRAATAAASRVNVESLGLRASERNSGLAAAGIASHERGAAGVEKGIVGGRPRSVERKEALPANVENIAAYPDRD